MLTSMIIYSSDHSVSDLLRASLVHLDPELPAPGTAGLETKSRGQSLPFAFSHSYAGSWRILTSNYFPISQFWMCDVLMFVQLFEESTKYYSKTLEP